MSLDARRLRLSFPGWPSITRVELLERLRVLDSRLAPLVRDGLHWLEVSAVVMEDYQDARLLFPDWDRALTAHALDWLALAHESCGNTSSAIWCIWLRLRIRRPRNPWRRNQYLSLVNLLAREGLLQDALSHAVRGARFASRRGDVEAMRALGRARDELRERLR